LLASPSALRAEEATRVRSSDFDIDYRVNAEAKPLESVRMWYTLDGGLTWTDYGLDEDRVSPIRFHAPGEGLFGFFLVLTNTAGPSSAPPSKSTPPQQWALVDFTPPVVQLHQVRQTTSFGEAVVQIRWTAVDAQLTPRPIELLYSRPGDEKQLRIAPEPVANTGRYDWRVPAELTGSFSIRVAATDRGGHRTESEAQTIELGAVNPPPKDAGPTSTGGGSAATGSDDALTGSQRGRERAARLFAEAMTYRDRGEFTEGVTRLREAVKLNPQLTDAFAEMAGMLYRLGDLDRALGAYDIALKQQPNSREALRGVARVFQQKSDYPAAAERLRTILRYNPTDAEVWLQLGDIAVYQGDEVRARECYTRAAQIDPKASQVVADARQRLALMSEVSRDPTTKKR
jgi:hypothetical protein